MEKTIYRSKDRGFADHGWLKARHSFSFASYYRPDRMNFGVLRVLNDDEIAPGMGFREHPHDNMEIVTIPLDGVVAHRDCMGHEEAIAAGEVQAMSAGSGITHSEYNASHTQVLRLLQIWILPREQNVKPRYDQKKFELEVRAFTTLVSPDRRNSSLQIHQDAIFSRGLLSPGDDLSYQVQFAGNGVYLFVIRGSVLVDGETLSARDAVGIRTLEHLEIRGEDSSDVLCIELPTV